MKAVQLLILGMLAQLTNQRYEVPKDVWVRELKPLKAAGLIEITLEDDASPDSEEPFQTKVIKITEAGLEVAKQAQAGNDLTESDTEPEVVL